MIEFECVILFFLISTSHCRLPDKAFCVNLECSEPISKAKTLLNYNSGDPDLMSFRGNSDAIVFKKSAGSNSDIWYANINGKSGYVPSKFLREYKVLERNPKFILPVKQNPIVLQPNKVQQPHEVIEGTTIINSEPSPQETEAESTTVPSETSSEQVEITPINIDQNLEHVHVENKENTPKTNLENIINSNVINESLTETVDDDESTTSNETVSPSLPDEDYNINIHNESINNVNTSVIDDSNDNTLEDNTDQDPDQDQESPDTEEELTSEDDDDANLEQNIANESNDNASLESVQVPEKIDFNSDIDTDNSVSQENLPSNPIDNVDSELPVDNIVVSKNLQEEQIQTENTPQVPDTKSQTLVSEPIVNNIKPININGKQIPNNFNYQETPPPIPVLNTEVPPARTQPTIPPLETGTRRKTIPPAFDYHTPIDTKNSVPEASRDIPVINAFESTTEVSNTMKTIHETTTKVSNTMETIPETTTEVSNTMETIPETTTEVSNSMETLPETTTEVSNTMETIPETTTEVSNTMETLPETIQKSYPTESVPLSESNPTYNTDTTTSSPHLEHMTSETIIEEIFSPTTEAPLASDESSEGLLSNIYTTIADMIPPTTESPPSVYNSDYVQDDTDRSFSFVNYLLNTYHTVMGTREESSALFPSGGGTCFTDEYCDGEGNKPNRLLTFLLTTAGSVLLFTLGYYYIEGTRQDNRLIGNIDNLQRELLFTSKECKILKEELSATKTKLAGIEDNSFGMDDMVQSLRGEINDLKENNERLRNSLDDNEKLLRVSENTAGELQNTLGEVENTLSELFAERAHSEEQITELNGKIQAFQEELISVSRERDNFQLKYVSAESALEEFKKQKKLLEETKQTLSDAHNTIELQRHEIVALKDAIKELKGGTSSSTDVKSLIDQTEIKAKLAKALEEKNSFMTKYEVEHRERSRLSEELNATLESYKTSSQQASEATTRLEVLGKYFQERESELMKELSTKEALWLSKQGESTSTVEKIELMQEEVQRYKERCDVLTRELAEQESSSRASLGAVEARAHAAWLDARAARRDRDAAREDAAALRRKMVALHDGANDSQRALASPLEPDLGLPAAMPPPLAFLPPLLPPLPRPPPLGRLPSPPRFGERRYSPGPRFSPVSYYPPERRYSPESRYSPETVRYSPESRYSPRSRRPPYSPRRRRSVDRYNGRESRTRNGPGDTETEYNSDSPTRRPSRRRYSRQSGPSSGSGCSSESGK